MKNYAPIILFVYGRLDHTQRTIESLKKNKISMDSDLFIYSDFYKREKDIKDVSSVREYIKTIDGFKSVSIIYRNENYGLAKNIIDGVTEVINKYGKAIVLEDDIVTSPYFLSFMNNALNKYQNDNNVWHISGWNYPINANDYDDSFFWNTMNCWGWATWSDRWSFFKKDPDTLISEWDQTKIKKFNLDGTYDFWSQVNDNYTGKLNTWAIFWYATIFDNSGLCLNPTKTLVHNIGNDGSGENCGSKDIYYSTLANKLPELYDNVIINECVVNEIKYYYKKLTPPIYKRLYHKVKELFV